MCVVYYVLFGVFQIAKHIDFCLCIFMQNMQGFYTFYTVQTSAMVLGIFLGRTAGRYLEYASSQTAGLGHHQHAMTMADSRTLATNQRQNDSYSAYKRSKINALQLALVVWLQYDNGRTAALEALTCLACRGYSRLYVPFWVYPSHIVHFSLQFSPRRFFALPYSLPPGFSLPAPKTA